jgi:TrmH family RNA methyltransferase
MNLSSYHNQHLKLARRIREGKERELILIEGSRLIAECLASGLELKMAFNVQSSPVDSSDLAAKLRSSECPVYDVDEKLLSSLSDTVTPQGMIVIAKRPQHSIVELLQSGDSCEQLVVLLDRVQDPGNAGTIVRTAEAAGATGIAASAGTVDLLSPKALRASMGSAFRLPIVPGVSVTHFLDAARRGGIAVVGTAADGDSVYSDHDWTRPTLVMLGNEAGGLAAELLAHCDTVVRIPLTEPVESLNVASAAAALLFEAARQRRQSRNS